VHLLLKRLAIVASFVFLTASAEAAPISAGDLFRVSGGGSIRGGQFGVTSTTTPKSFDDFYTFCIEVAQAINSPGGPYRVAALAKQTSTGTPLSGGAAFLYTQFAQGTLAGYTAGKQDALQAALWKYQGYDSFVISSGVTVASYFAGSADAQAFYNLAGAQAWQASGKTGHVFIMQNETTKGVARQDFLTVQDVPEPATLAELGSIVDQVLDRSTDQHRIAGHPFRQVVGDIDLERQPLGLRARFQGLRKRARERRGIEALGARRQLAAAGTGAVHHHGGEAGKMLGGALQRHRPVVLRRRQAGGCQELGQHADAVEGGPDLMRQGGERRLQRIDARPRRTLAASGARRGRGGRTARHGANMPKICE